MRYSPPKSSCWGHSLGKMKPEKQKELFDKFFGLAVDEYSFSSGSVCYQPDLQDILQNNSFLEFDEYFQRLLNIKQSQPDFSNLSEKQFEICLKEIIHNPSLYVSGKTGVAVVACYQIKAWKIAGKRVPTHSMLIIYFGAKPIITPMFNFKIMTEFEYIRQVLKELEICKLNPKHIKKSH
ncbi:MAG: hypothetical protein PHD29_07610 [bacterium]|nr:hypothetical protein [bacterium]MDD5756844.1 hypothetical protein [bacterium]